jgi:hypothetical protein
MIRVVVPVVLLAAVLLLLGAWGRRHVRELAFVPGMTDERVTKRERVMRRGCVACSAVGTVFLGVAVLALLFPA